MVTGPVSIAFMGLLVRVTAYSVQETVSGSGRATSPKRTGGRTQRDP